MAEVVYSARALAHLESAFEFMGERDADAATAAARAIRTAVSMLAAHPFLGRRVRGDIRELVISYGRTGYVALYRFAAGAEEVRILAIKHQRQLRYPV